MEKYIGQSDLFGYWVNEAIGGRHEVIGISRTGASPKKLPKSYKTAKTAEVAAKREIENNR